MLKCLLKEESTNLVEFLHAINSRVTNNLGSQGRRTLSSSTPRLASIAFGILASLLVISKGAQGAESP